MQAKKVCTRFFLLLFIKVFKKFGYLESQVQIWLQKFDSFLSSKFAEVLKDKLLRLVLLFD